MFPSFEMSHSVNNKGPANVRPSFCPQINPKPINNCLSGFLSICFSISSKCSYESSDIFIAFL